MKNVGAREKGALIYSAKSFGVDCKLYGQRKGKFCAITSIIFKSRDILPD
jgi:hypothetical protein